MSGPDKVLTKEIICLVYPVLPVFFPENKSQHGLHSPSHIFPYLNNRAGISTGKYYKD